MPDDIRTSAEPWTGALPAETYIELSPTQNLLLTQELRAGSLKTSPIVASISRTIRQLLSCNGVAIIGNLPVDDWSEQEATKVYLALGNRLGILREQKAAGDLLHAVTDQTVLGMSAETAGGSNSRKRIDLHTENARPPHPPHVLSLLCLSSARSGGESLFLDGFYVHRELARDQELLNLAYEPKAFGRHSEDCAFAGQLDYSPIFWTHAGRVNFRYSRYWINLAAVSLEGGLSKSDQMLFDRIDKILSDTGAIAKMLLRPGDAIFIDNRRVMHGRESFEDHPEPARRRRLLRMWIDTPDITEWDPDSDRLA